MNSMMAEQQDIQNLLEKAQGGDRESFERLVESARDTVETYVRQRVGAHLREKVEVEDVLQETFVEALRSLESFQWRGAGSFPRWLQGIAEHVILKLAGRNRRDPLFYVEVERAANDVPPSRLMRRDERFDRLQQALDTLSPDHREVIVLARLEGLRIAEVAKRMHRTPNAVAHLLSRALASLKDAFGDTESLHLPPRRFEEGGPKNES
jgi:RNA polymerase sigma-70 factor (ECF subfamily)